MNEALDLVLAHWPFIVFTLVAAMVVQIFKGAVWTAKRAEGKGAKAGFFWWMRKTLPLHPVAAGALFGLIPGLPLSNGMEPTMATAMMYYAAAGLVSTWAFAVLKGIAKRKGIELPTANGETTPPPAREDHPTPKETPIPKAASEPPDMGDSGRP
jgi:hypothetical protein